MRVFFISFLFSMFIVVFCQPVAAVSTIGHAVAVIMQDIRIVRQEPLSFGSIVRADSAGKIIISPNGNRKYNGLIRLGADLYQAASFDIEGQANRSYNIHVPTEIFFKAIGASQPLLVNDIKIISRNDPNAQNKGYLDTKGVDHLSVGATLNVPAGAPAGLYKGFVPISVSY